MINDNENQKHVCLLTDVDDKIMYFRIESGKRGGYLLEICYQSSCIMPINFKPEFMLYPQFKVQEKTGEAELFIQSFDNIHDVYDAIDRYEDYYYTRLPYDEKENTLVDWGDKTFNRFVWWGT